jgi:hypothetical protein
MINATDKIHALLRDRKPRTMRQICDELGFVISTVSISMAQLRESHEVHIKAYDRGPKNCPMAIWVIGRGTDAKKPKPLTQKQLVHSERTKIADREREKRLREEMARPAFRHWQDAALFGEYRGAA